MMKEAFKRHIGAEEAKGNKEGVKLLKAQQTIFNSFVTSGAVTELPLESRESKPSSQEAEGTEMKGFSDEAREALIEKKYKIYKLKGRSVNDQGVADRRSIWIHRQNNNLELYKNEKSMHSEVAIHPDFFFLPESNSKTISEQRAMLENFSKNFCEQVPEVDVVMGNAADYASLTLEHLRKERVYDERLFGEKYKHGYTATSTYSDSKSDFIAIVGNNRDEHGLTITGFNINQTNESVHVAPLVVPR
jgi:hypothetical protein